MAHYSKAQKPGALRDYAVEAAARIISHFHGKRATPVLCYTGMSGTATATALSLALHAQCPEFTFGMCYVRKANERSHGSMEELDWTGDKEPPLSHERIGVFVDDFVSCGNTLRRVVRRTKHICVWDKNKSYASLSGSRDGSWEASCFVLVSSRVSPDTWFKTEDYPTD